MSREGQVRVTLADGQQFVLRGRAAKIVEWVAAQAAELNEAEFGALTFDCGPKVTKPRFQKGYPPLTSEA